MRHIRVMRASGEVARSVEKWRDQGFSIGFVPTMGALHRGHLSLVELALEATDKVIVSIFVNPSQFGQGEDLESYPRTASDDIDMLEKAGVHGIFLPDVDEIYPDGFSTTVSVSGLTDTLCGRYRPDHFHGVATVCTVLFGIVKPDVAVFGRKDAQQLAVIKRLIRDLRLSVRVLEGDIFREPDGLAMSSRNMYLQPSERRQATALYRGLSRAAELMTQGERNAKKLQLTVRNILEESPLADVQYVEIVDPDTMLPVEKIDGSCLLAAAVYFGGTRLIDNIILNPGGDRKEE